MLIDLAVDLATLIESTIVVDRVSVTPGEPAHSDSCTAAYVWGTQIFDSPIGVQARGDEAGCLFRRAYEIRYRIDVCMPVGEGGKEVTTAQYLATATQLYDFSDEVWCAIAENASAGSLFAVTGIGCEDVVVGTLQIEEPQGDRVSAEGYVRVTYPCQPGS